QSKYNEAVQALDGQQYEKARVLFDEFTELAAHFDKLDRLYYRPHERGLTRSLRAIVEKLRKLRSAADLDDLKAQARDKGFLATRHADVRAEAERLHRAAEHMRFRLLLNEEDLPALSLEVQQALKRFYVLEQENWTELTYLFGMLDPKQQAQLE